MDLESVLPFVFVLVVIFMFGVLLIRLLRSKVETWDFEKFYGFRPEGERHDGLKRAVAMVLEQKWSDVSNAKRAMEDAERSFACGKTPDVILLARADFEEKRTVYEIVADNFSRKMKLAIKFGYLDQLNLRHLHPAIVVFARDSGLIASA